jgi:hypothetical protein
MLLSADEVLIKMFLIMLSIITSYMFVLPNITMFFYAEKNIGQYDLTNEKRCRTSSQNYH